MTSAIRILDPMPLRCCMPWRLRNSAKGEIHGARCCFCDREVAATKDEKGKTVACIYCGLERGFLPAVEIEPFSDGEPRPWVYPQ